MQWNGTLFPSWCTGHQVNLGVLENRKGFKLRKRRINIGARMTRTHGSRRVLDAAGKQLNRKFWTIPRVRKLRFVAHMRNTIRAYLHNLPGKRK